MDGLKGDTGFDGEPVKLLKNRRDVVNGGGSGDDASGRVLDQLKSCIILAAVKTTFSNCTVNSILHYCINAA